jgi:hypothetical protein
MGSVLCFTHFLDRVAVNRWPASPFPLPLTPTPTPTPTPAPVSRAPQPQKLFLTSLHQSAEQAHARRKLVGVVNTVCKLVWDSVFCCGVVWPGPRGGKDFCKVNILFFFLRE